MCRLYLGRKRSSVSVPLSQDQVQELTPGLMLNMPQEGRTCITLNASGEVDQLGNVLRAAWDSQKAIRTRTPETFDVDSAIANRSGTPAEADAVKARTEASSGGAAQKRGWGPGDVEVAKVPGEPMKGEN
jgi:hypothetical protein